MRFILQFRSIFTNALLEISPIRCNGRCYPRPVAVATTAAPAVGGDAEDEHGAAAERALRACADSWLNELQMRPAGRSPLINDTDGGFRPTSEAATAGLCTKAGGVALGDERRTIRGGGAWGEEVPAAHHARRRLERRSPLQRELHIK